MTYITEAMVERSIKTLRNAIEAAENSNQSGEDFVVAAAVAPSLLKALQKLAGNAGALRAFEHEIIEDAGFTNWTCLMDAVAAADDVIAKAKGKS